LVGAQNQKKKNSHFISFPFRRRSKVAKEEVTFTCSVKKNRTRWKGPTLLTAEQTNLQPRTMWLSKIEKSPRDSGYLDCSFNTNLVMVIKSVLWASAEWSISLSLFTYLSLSNLNKPVFYYSSRGIIYTCASACGARR
jgi:hypothetical protein